MTIYMDLGKEVDILAETIKSVGGKVETATLKADVLTPSAGNPHLWLSVAWPDPTNPVRAELGTADLLRALPGSRFAPVEGRMFVTGMAGGVLTGGEYRYTLSTGKGYVPEPEPEFAAVRRAEAEVSA